MPILQFPPLETADEHGLIAIGGDLEVESLLLAYRNGIFPWPIHSDILSWFAPPMRAVLFFNQFHISRSLKKFRSNSDWEIKIDNDFDTVIRECAKIINRPTQSGTWITPQIIESYSRLHSAGFAHSIECYEGSDLVGGVYGVCINGFFAAESMFYRKPNASKLCIWHLVELLSSHGIEWIDCQVMSPFLATFGTTEITRDEFMKILPKALALEVRPFS